ncbi:hypothetical protein FKP32DRAFT_1587329 [Trametes sanguinea]|nr:hypothetical protein FKP32DRAFT_1598366 [Trametes sanguinea]KAI9058830.1 hypothetical protein FKP32DRAFT_1597147 [Trametes sanguinea]KAI9064181.1 hypothetical protein FKP32DRAFT_1591604 [Trametes sanguinea]KAI9068863.1 hypothetical protein FKP32DRAFT_1587329 [Trametes sanguinea]
MPVENSSTVNDSLHARTHAHQQSNTLKTLKSVFGCYDACQLAAGPHPGRKIHRVDVAHNTFRPYVGEDNRGQSVEGK